MRRRPLFDACQRSNAKIGQFCPSSEIVRSATGSDQGQKMGKLILSRRRLFDMVWAKPMTQLAHDLGVTAKHLARACDRHDIPRPRPGHWQKLAHGQVPPMVELPEEHFNVDSLIVIEIDVPELNDAA